MDFPGRSLDNWGRRDDPRVVQLARVVRLLVDGESRSFALCNLSRRGASGRCEAPLAAGTMIALVFEDGTQIAGRVQWLQGSLNGISLFDNVPQHLIVRQVRNIQPRPRRISVNRPAIISFRDAQRRATIRNVSTGGMLLETMGQLRPGETIRIEAGGYSGMGEVRWSAGNRAGIRLLDPICLEQFEEATMATGTDRAISVESSPPVPPGNLSI